jgi:hypothetical protein
VLISLSSSREDGRPSKPALKRFVFGAVSSLAALAAMISVRLIAARPPDGVRATNSRRTMLGWARPGSHRRTAVVGPFAATRTSGGLTAGAVEDLNREPP